MQRKLCSTAAPQPSVSPVVARAAACVHPEPPVPAVAKTGRHAMARLYDRETNEGPSPKLSLAPTVTFSVVAILRYASLTGHHPDNGRDRNVSTDDRSTVSILSEAVTPVHHLGPPPTTPCMCVRVCRALRVCVCPPSRAARDTGTGRSINHRESDPSTHTHPPSIPPRERVSAAVLDRPAATGGRWGDPSKLKLLSGLEKLYTGFR
ncbi:hypothetical protein CSIM01_01540 [Colletotrichum simmondsii]|uniref:Uncharacterized protein n=1 Tax=Colletotrichum simmondsii TaxID=703756 RepID=A0A135TRH4_9PEZI|nr:hypothetical protein CSIM01_01540 [Colletotrichum simmondsii]